MVSCKGLLLSLWIQLCFAIETYQQSYGPQNYGYEQPQYGYEQPQYGPQQYEQPQYRPQYEERPQYEQPQGNYGYGEYGPPQQEYGPYAPPNEGYQPYAPPKEEYQPYVPPKEEYQPYVPPKHEYEPPKEEYEPPKEEYEPPKEEHHQEPEHYPDAKESKIVSINTDNAKIRLSRYPEPAHTECIDVAAEQSDGEKFADVTICFDPDLAEEGISLCCPPEPEHVQRYGHYYPPPYQPYDYYAAKPPAYGPSYGPYKKRDEAPEDIDLRYVQPGNDPDCRAERIGAVEEILTDAFYPGGSRANIESRQDDLVNSIYFDEHSVWKNTFAPNFEGSEAIARQFVQYQRNNAYFSAGISAFEAATDLHFDDTAQNAHITLNITLINPVSCEDPNGCANQEADIFMDLEFHWRKPCSPFSDTGSDTEDHILSHVIADIPSKKDLLTYVSYTSSYQWLHEDGNLTETPLELLCAVATGDQTKLEGFMNNCGGSFCIQPADYTVCSGVDIQYNGDFDECMEALKNKAARCGATHQVYVGDTTACRIQWLDAVALSFEGNTDFKGASCDLLGEDSPGCPAFTPEGYEPKHTYPAHAPYQPSYGGNSYQPSYGGSSYQPSYEGNSYQPSYGGNSYQPSYEGNSYQPSYEGNSYQPSYGGDSYQPSYGGDSYQPSYGGDSYNSYGTSPNPYHPDNAFGYNSGGYAPYKRSYYPPYGSNYGYSYPTWYDNEEKTLIQQGCSCLAYEAKVTFFNDSKCGASDGNGYGGYSYWDHDTETEEMEMIDHFSIDACCEVVESNLHTWRHVSCDGKHGYKADLYKDAHCKTPQLKKKKPVKEFAETKEYDGYTGYPAFGGGYYGSGQYGGQENVESVHEPVYAGASAEHAPGDDDGNSKYIQESYSVAFDVCEVFDDSGVSRYTEFPQVDGYDYFPCADKGPFGYLLPVTYIFKNSYGQFAFDQLTTVKPIIERVPAEYDQETDGDGYGGEHGGGYGGGYEGGNDGYPGYYKRSSHPVGNGAGSGGGGGGSSGGSSSGDGNADYVWKGKYKFLEGAPRGHKSNFIPYFGKGKYQELYGRAETAGFSNYKEDQILIFLEFDNYTPRDDIYEIPGHYAPDTGDQYYKPNEYEKPHEPAHEEYEKPYEPTHGEYEKPHEPTHEPEHKGGCWGNCGGQSIENDPPCYCEPSCVIYNDCCSNFCDACGGDYADECSKRELMDATDSYPTRPIKEDKRQVSYIPIIAGSGTVVLGLGLVALFVRRRRKHAVIVEA